MLRRSLCLSLFFTLISSSLCLSSFQDDPLANFLDQTPGYDPSAYPSYFGIIQDGQGDETLVNLPMELEAEIVDSMGYDQLGARAPTLEEANVDDFGAEGDGEKDDTEVLYHQHWGDDTWFIFFYCLIELIWFIFWCFRPLRKLGRRLVPQTLACLLSLRKSTVLSQLLFQGLAKPIL